MVMARSHFAHSKLSARHCARFGRQDGTSARQNCKQRAPLLIPTHIVYQANNGKSNVVKVVGLFKKKKGMSMEKFQDYYENHHIKLFDEHVAHPGVLRYSRRYLTPFAGLASPIPPPKDGGYDVIREVWYKDKELFNSFKGQSDPSFAEIIKEDEDKFFDRESMVMFLSEDHESKDGPWNV